jgi:4-aminobutyrate aminotransferase-like enzyme
VAGFVVEAFQGESGYRVADGGWLREVADICHDAEVLVIADEIQTFARTGEVFAFEHFGVSPDIIALSKASVVGVTLASDRVAAQAGLGWHSTTWGGGKVLDNTYAATAIETYLNYEDPLFGCTYLQNQRNKAAYIRGAFAWLAEAHPGLVTDFRGLGGMWGFTVRHRDEVCKEALQHGLKLLSCGVTDEPSSVRALFLADVLTKEVDCFARLLDSTLSAVESRRDM